MQRDGAYAEYRDKLGKEEYGEICAEHALPENFETTNYPDFLEKRRVLTAQVVKKAYEKLCR